MCPRSHSKLTAGWLLAPSSPGPPSSPPSAHHEERPFCLAEADDHDQGDAHHGGQGQAPAQPDGPGGVHVYFVVGQGYVLDERENETSLWKEGGSQGGPRHWEGPRQVPPQGPHILLQSAAEGPPPVQIGPRHTLLPWAPQNPLQLPCAFRMQSLLPAW